MQDRRDQQLPEKVNRILNVILIALLLIVLRVWHLAVIQHDDRIKQSQKPQYKTILEPAKRGTIRDRFNMPLAVNTMKYNAAIHYSQLRQIPTVVWEKGLDGKKIKRFKRKEYIAALAKLLGDELQIDPERIADLIYSKAIFYGHMPFVIKEDISEKQYFRLKMLEKDWLGVHVQHCPRRSYPMGKIAGDVVGYIGAINREEYERILREIHALESLLEGYEQGEEIELPFGLTDLDQVRQRLKTLLAQTYSINDTIGKAGIEKSCERYLRGCQGRKTYYSDARGDFLRELAGSTPPLSGQRLLLSLSAELQVYAEQLLAENESIRQARISNNDGVRQSIMGLQQPWIKGGAIVALDPNTGDILALASYPRFDPNDFIFSGQTEEVKAKKSRVGKWLESESYIGEIWDQKRPLEREHFREDLFYDEEVILTWDRYLERILPAGHPVQIELQRLGTIEGAVARQRVQGEMDYDQLLLIDLCRLCVLEENFGEPLLQKKGKVLLSDYRSASAAKVVLEDAVKSMVSELFQDLTFKSWRSENEKNFLKEKRKQEKSLKSYQKPYIEYLDSESSRQFKAFWDRYHLQLLLTLVTGYQSHEKTLEPYEEHLAAWHAEIDQGAHANIFWRPHYMVLQRALEGLDTELSLAYLKTMRGFKDLDKPLKGRYRHLRNDGGQQMQKHLAAAFYPRQGFGYGRSQTYRQAAPQGSIFKLVTSYAALKQRYEELDNPHATFADLNPLEIVDHTHKRGKETYIGYDINGKPIPRAYKKGRLPRSPQAYGRLDLLRALEISSNPYFSLLAGDYLHAPQDLANAASGFSFGAKTGIALPGEISGQIPDDLETNLTGLYSMAIGQHTLVVTPLQTALMLASIANGGTVLHPQIIYERAGEKVEKSALKEIAMPSAIRNMLFEGMRRVVLKTYNDSLGRLSRIYRDHPEAISDYIDMKGDMLGKTSTAEMMENLSLDYLHGTNLYKHVWFGGIAFDKEMPELVVVVYLRFGNYGKEAAPLAAQIVKKWREIKEKHHQKK